MAGDGRGVDERAGFGAGHGVGEVGALGVVRGVVAGWGQDHVGDCDGVEACAVYEGGGGDGAGLAVGGCGCYFPAVFAGVERRDGCHGGVEGADAAAVFKVAFEELHQAVRVYDTGGGAFENAGFGAYIGFAVCGFVLGEEVCGDADGGGEVVDFVDGGHLLRVLGDDPFSGVAVGDGVFPAEFIHHFLAAEA